MFPFDTNLGKVSAEICIQWPDYALGWFDSHTIPVMNSGAVRNGLISRDNAGVINRGRVLQALYDTGPLSRADLARLTGVTRAVIGRIVQDMIDEALLAELPAQSSSNSGGKPPRPLWFSVEAPPALTAHLLPESVEVGLVSAGGEVLERTQAPTAGATGGDSVTATLCRVLRSVLDKSNRAPLGIGIAVGGMVDTETGSIVRVNLAPELDGLELGPRVERESGLPVWLDQHPRAQALGDRWFGQGRGRSSFASLYVGEAIGAGLVIDGAVHRGRAGSGGEVGHTTVQLDGRECRCGRTGCWETIAAHDWLREQARALRLPGCDTIEAPALARLAAVGVDGAEELLDTYAHHIAAGLANLYQTFAPELFILHGPVAGGGEPLRSRIERHLLEGIPAHPAGPPQLTFSAAPRRATLLGAAGLVFSHALRLPGSEASSV